MFALHRPWRFAAAWTAFIVLSTAAEVVAAEGRTAVGPGASLMSILAEELDYSFKNLATPEDRKPYYIAYAVYDEDRATVAATLGAIMNRSKDRSRNLNIDVRVGEYRVDNTHQIRGQGGSSRARSSGNISLALTDDSESIRQALWYHTDGEFKQAVERYEGVLTNMKVKVEEEDTSDDFSKEEPQTALEPIAPLVFDEEAWAVRLRKISRVAAEYPLVYGSSVTAAGYVCNRWILTTEGTRLQTAETRYRITMSADTKAEDGMDLQQFSDFNAASPEGLPGDAEIETAFRKVLDQVVALRSAPLAEPYSGPAILRNRASGVFFHEIFGHRIEGHRQKDVTEGQTFTKKLGQPVLPDFISVIDDPTLAKHQGTDLRGHYHFDDEGVPALRTVLVDGGVLKTFLLSRTPVATFARSNGHGRRAPGRAVVSRQANLLVESSRKMPYAELRKTLTEECARQEKPYGLLFEDISGGFTTTGRQGPQSFKVLPIIVYRVYGDGRPDELIRGVDIVGTPLACFEKITHVADDPAVFNGSCGAESGWVPVSAISPSLLVSTIEIEKRYRDQGRPPILEPPFGLRD